MDLTGMQYAVLNAYEFLSIVQHKYRDKDTGVLWVSFYRPLTIVVGIEPDGQLRRGERDRV